MDDQTPAPLSLTVSLTSSGMELLRTSIPLQTNLLCSNCGQEPRQQSTHTSDTGSISQNLQSVLDDSHLRQIAELAFEQLGWGDGNDDPVMVALRLARSVVFKMVEGAGDDDQSGPHGQGG
jgi:hypothetical protein